MPRSASPRIFPYSSLPVADLGLLEAHYARGMSGGVDLTSAVAPSASRMLGAGDTIAMPEYLWFLEAQRSCVIEISATFGSVWQREIAGCSDRDARSSARRDLDGLEAIRQRFIKLKIRRGEDAAAPAVAPNKAEGHVSKKKYNFLPFQARRGIPVLWQPLPRKMRRGFLQAGWGTCPQDQITLMHQLSYTPIVCRAVTQSTVLRLSPAGAGKFTDRSPDTTMWTCFTIIPRLS